MTNCFTREYPTNVRFGQYLVDCEKTPESYFDVANNDDVGAKFARAVYTRFYGSEIGLEELDIFDLKMKGIWGANIDLYKGFYTARGGFIDGIESGEIESEKTEYGHTLTDETDAEKKDVETTHGDSVVFTDVSTDDGTRTKEYKITHSDGGSDTRTRTKTGDAENYKNIVETGRADIFRDFIEKFINLFMGVL